MRGKSNISIVIAFLVILASCSDKSVDETNDIAVFVPGVLEGSPTYEMMDSGVRKAADEAGIAVKTVEGGFDQASWETQLKALASEGHYGLIVTSNPAMTELAVNVGRSFPEQDFLVLDGSGLASDRVIDIVYDHLEQAFLIGYFAGLATMSGELDGANEELRAGLIAGQEYPQMNRAIRPGFEIGLHAVNPDIKLEFRVLGNWYDAEKARELASGLYESGVDIILTIAGGANQGVIAAARDAGSYVLWFDSPGSDLAPGTVLASAVIAQDEAARRWTQSWIDGELESGTSIDVGITDGFIDFPMDDRHFRKYVPESIRNDMVKLLDRMKSGELSLKGLDG